MNTVKKVSILSIFSLSLCLWTNVLFSTSPTAAATKPALSANYPKRYVVKEGDTLWGIAGKILQHPWQWKQLLANNPHISNPQRIYPGDIIEISIRGNKPILHIKQTGTVKLSPKSSHANKSPSKQVDTVKLSPKVRITSLDNAIPTIPLTDIKPFISGNRIVDPETLTQAPRIVAHEGERIIAGKGDVIYAAGFNGKDTTVASQYSLFRHGETFKNAKTEELIGTNAIYVGDAELLKSGEPATLILTYTQGEVLKGDKLLPRDTSDLQVYFTPKAPDRPVSGQIINIEGGLLQVGQYQVVLVDQGTQSGLEPGDVLEIYTNSRKVTNMGEDGKKEDPISIPGHKEGELMIFRTFKTASYALILTASNTVHLFDKVVSPRN